MTTSGVPPDGLHVRHHLLLPPALRGLARFQGIVPGRIVEISSYYSMLACVAAGGGICMMPKSLLETLPGASRVQAHEIPARSAAAETWLMWRRDCRSANLKAFIAELKNHLNPADQSVSAAA